MKLLFWEHNSAVLVKRLRGPANEIKPGNVVEFKRYDEETKKLVHVMKRTHRITETGVYVLGAIPEGPMTQGLKALFLLGILRTK
ncbi:hypothetical protein L596_020265 [Steinernema carpocapsae]|uniref:Uncharacterized protein n=1 Tax=Steinernema carpocapsae TaxID=34508 RepID=A0A4U5MT06_STECR|nr:hypothetical protein L596_020265 [Steinernema carpocapsae]